MLIKLAVAMLVVFSAAPGFSQAGLCNTYGIWDFTLQLPGTTAIGAAYEPPMYHWTSDGSNVLYRMWSELTGIQSTVVTVRRAGQPCAMPDLCARLGVMTYDQGRGLLLVSTTALVSLIPVFVVDPGSGEIVDTIELVPPCAQTTRLTSLSFNWVDDLVIANFGNHAVYLFDMAGQIVGMIPSRVGPITGTTFDGTWYFHVSIPGLAVGDLARTVSRSDAVGVLNWHLDGINPLDDVVPEGTDTEWSDSFQRTMPGVPFVFWAGRFVGSPSADGHYEGPIVPYVSNNQQCQALPAIMGGPCATLAVTWDYYWSEKIKDQVIVSWGTLAERDTVAFCVLRSDSKFGTYESAGCVSAVGPGHPYRYAFADDGRHWFRVLEYTSNGPGAITPPFTSDN